MMHQVMYQALSLNYNFKVVPYHIMHQVTHDGNWHKKA